MRHLCYAFVVLLLAASCRDKVICPTFQSTYILDDSVRNTYFSYLWYLNEQERKDYLASKTNISPPDSLGEMVASAKEGVDYWDYTAEYKVPPRETKQTKYGLAKRAPLVPNLVRNLQMKTSPMENVLTPAPPEETEEETPPTSAPDSTAYAPLDSTAAVAQVDSLNAQALDSTAVAQPAAKEKKAPWEPFRYGFDPMQPMHPDQEYYFRKYGWLLQNKPPKKEASDSTATTSDSTATEKKGLKGLFKKKDKGEKPPKEKKPKKQKEEPEGQVNEEALPEEEEDEGF